ncbi:homeodomain-like superfamily protein [Striga asiatica]|uniref:Homeodomain-like superfamily protein n=1 Tax=Striga asiatica TaxID=4170 RepID=A0A5A7P185_STRAF|nr:homeodomain-like superfamily protein [Striga asiatica]
MIVRPNPRRLSGAGCVAWSCDTARAGPVVPVMWFGDGAAQSMALRHGSAAVSRETTTMELRWVLVEGRFCEKGTGASPAACGFGTKWLGLLLQIGSLFRFSGMGRDAC